MDAATGPTPRGSFCNRTRGLVIDVARGSLTHDPLRPGGTPVFPSGGDG